MARQSESLVVKLLEIAVATNFIIAIGQIRHGWPRVGSVFLCGFVLIAAVVICYSRYRAHQLRALKLANIDTMTGREFENFVERLLRHQGYKTTLTPASGDLGVDVVAVLGTDRIAIQCKRHSRDISRTAVSDAVAGQSHYRCNRAMVVTNRDFTIGAKQLARSTECILIGRRDLARWIQEFQQAA